MRLRLAHGLAHHPLDALNGWPDLAVCVPFAADEPAPIRQASRHWTSYLSSDLPTHRIGRTEPVHGAGLCAD